jgi:hypothetical protein
MVKRYYSNAKQDVSIMIFCKPLIWSGINFLFIVTTPKPQKRKRFAGIVTKTKTVNMILTLSGLNQKILDHKGQTGSGHWQVLREYLIDFLKYYRA